ncbi:hypothetical protein RUM44_013606 [Polyplax serrata]|uniref:Uncharacterized protein n=1 Tax=Polyplax serrata TaxID=468196 RepID=A0ABR1BI92_POLSC
MGGIVKNLSGKVQPIPELCELTRRSGLDGHYVVLDDSNIRGGTLKRSGSLRFKKVQDSLVLWLMKTPLIPTYSRYKHKRYLTHNISQVYGFIDEI